MLSDSIFQTFTETNFIFYKADFPQRKKLSQAEIKLNEQLAERYNPDGHFPRILIIGSDKNVITVLSYNKQSNNEFIAELNSIL